MSEPFLAEIKIFGFDFAPRGWAQCDGQLLPINQNQSLFSLLGTTYGGDGRTDFALPDLRGRVPIHAGSGAGLTPRALGARSGTEQVALSADQMPAHNHRLQASSDPGASDSPTNVVLASGRLPAYGAPEDQVPWDDVQAKGGGQAHENMQPSLALNFNIALVGLFPSRN